MELSAAHAVVASMVAQVHTQREAHRAAGGTEDEFLDEWIPVFVAQARQHPGPAVLVHMALALYSLGLATAEIARLNDLVAMHREWLDREARA